MTALVWFRHDLRLYDNPALCKAAELQEGVVAVYVHCAALVKAHNTAPAQLDFIRRHLIVLQRDLLKLNIPLIVIKVAEPENIAPALLNVAQSYEVSYCFFNAEYPLDELRRDQQVNQTLKDVGIVVKRCHDRVIVPPGIIRNGQGEPYRVFTAYKKKWLQTASSMSMRPHGVPDKQVALSVVDTVVFPERIETLFMGEKLRDLSQLWPAGEDEAQTRLQYFIEHSLRHYKEQRDIPSVAGTSTLSPYLAVGAISPRQCVSEVLNFTHGEWAGQNEGASCWISEIIWREFYQHLMVDFPRLSMSRAMQAHTELFPWRKDTNDFNAWCEGRTGIPIVDAAMRQLNATGWMHNRLRMVVAMFLTKNLQIDWRWGEAYFMSQLIDGDFAANNGGWQWSASTGTDAAPYFRIFNPISQSERFDPEGIFLRKWIPELSNLSNKQIHNPPLVEGYPSAIVDLSKSRKDTIALFKGLQPAKNN